MLWATPWVWFVAVAAAVAIWSVRRAGAEQTPLLEAEDQRRTDDPDRVGEGVALGALAGAPAVAVRVLAVGRLPRAATDDHIGNLQLVFGHLQIVNTVKDGVIHVNVDKLIYGQCALDLAFENAQFRWVD